MKTFTNIALGLFVFLVCVGGYFYGVIEGKTQVWNQIAEQGLNDFPTTFCEQRCGN